MLVATNVSRARHVYTCRRPSPRHACAYKDKWGGAGKRGDGVPARRPASLRAAPARRPGPRRSSARPGGSPRPPARVPALGGLSPRPVSRQQPRRPDRLDPCPCAVAATGGACRRDPAVAGAGPPSESLRGACCRRSAVASRVLRLPAVPRRSPSGPPRPSRCARPAAAGPPTRGPARRPPVLWRWPPATLAPARVHSARPSPRAGVDGGLKQRAPSAAVPGPSRSRRTEESVPPDPASGGSSPSPASRDLRRPRARRRHPTWRAGVESAHASGVSARVVLAVCMCNQATGGPRRCGRTRTQVSTYVYT